MSWDVAYDCSRLHSIQTASTILLCRFKNLQISTKTDIYINDCSKNMDAKLSAVATTKYPLFGNDTEKVGSFSIDFYYFWFCIFSIQKTNISISAVF